MHISKTQLLASISLLWLALNSSGTFAANDGVSLPTNQHITPTAAKGSVESWVIAGADSHERKIGQITRTALSPDGTQLVALSSGFNRYSDTKGQLDNAKSNEVVLVYALNGSQPQLIQTLEIPNTFNGITFSDDGNRLLVSGGKDDVLYSFHREGVYWQSDGEPIALNSGPSLSIDRVLGNNGIGTLAAGVALFDQGQRAIVSQFEHDAIEVVDLNEKQVIQRLDLRPGKENANQQGVPGGEFPLDVVTTNDQRAFVASVRDREIDVLSLLPTAHVTARLKLPGQPTRLLTDRQKRHLFVAIANVDQIWIYDTQTLKQLMRASTRIAPIVGQGSGKPGSNPNNLALSADEKTLFVTNAGDNAVVGFHIDWKEHELEPLGAIPTGWYPSAVTADPLKPLLYVFNAKTVSGPNRLNCKSTLSGPNRASGCNASLPSRSGNDYVLQLIHSTLITIPIPKKTEWNSLTRQVALNNDLNLNLSEEDRRKITLLQKNIKHVIYIVRENRTFDQILGDLPHVEADPTRAQFPQIVTPNAHRLASQFSAIDHYFCSGDVSMNGWQWSTGARVSDLNEKIAFLNYARRGGSYDSEGGTRNINNAIGDGNARVKANPLLRSLNDPDLLPGARNPVELDGDSGEPGAGYLWSSALRAHRVVRNYGFFIDLSRYDSNLESTHPEAWIKPEPYPRSHNHVVAYPTHEELIGRTDPYFWGFNTRVPDYYRVQEWLNEFNEFEKTGALPNLSLVRLMMDHTGSFKETLDEVNTPEIQIADNDYALGLLIEKVAHSRFAKDTLIVITEDDAQDGPDHIDAHRSPAFIIGPYTQQDGRVISTPYTTVNLIKTIEVILGINSLNARDNSARPMLDVFNLQKPQWTYDAVPSKLLRLTKIPLPTSLTLSSRLGEVKPMHDASWWEEQTKGFDFSSEDRVDANLYNRLLWLGTMGTRPYPEESETITPNDQ